jgi:hypothetical protein
MSHTPSGSEAMQCGDIIRIVVANPSLQYFRSDRMRSNYRANFGVGCKASGLDKLETIV